MNKKLNYIVFLSLMILAAFSHSYSWDTCNGHAQKWMNNWTTMDLSTKSFPVGSYYEQRVQWMMAEWNAVAGSAMTFYVGRDTDGEHMMGNWDNELYWDNLGESTLGRTYKYNECYWLFGNHWGKSEVDLAMNSNSSLNWSDAGFRSVVLHELGHALGLMHTDSLAVMNDSSDEAVSFADTPRAVSYHNWITPLADDRAGLRFLYGNDGISRNVAVSRFYVNDSGDKLQSFPSRTSLRAGDSFALNYTVENHGTEREDYVLVYFYLSSDSYITTSDRYIGAAAWVMPSGSSAQARIEIILPAGLAEGDYYVGFIADPHDNITEDREFDNQISLNRTINVW